LVRFLGLKNLEKMETGDDGKPIKRIYISWVPVDGALPHVTKPGVTKPGATQGHTGSRVVRNSQMGQHNSGQMGST
jgi:hypothetical protein